MTIAGCDFSSKAVDIVLLDEDTDAAVWHRFELHGQDAFDRARSVRAAMPARGWWEDQGVLAVGIEQPRGRFALVDLGRIQGAVLACLPTSLLVQPWNPAQWRKQVGLPGNAPKLSVAGWAIARWTNAPGPYALEQDSCDAFCIALATRMVVEALPVVGREAA